MCFEKLHCTVFHKCVRVEVYNKLPFIASLHSVWAFIHLTYPRDSLYLKKGYFIQPSGLQL